MWFIGVEVEQETSAPPPKKDPGSAPAHNEDHAKLMILFHLLCMYAVLTIRQFLAQIAFI